MLASGQDTVHRVTKSQTQLEWQPTPVLLPGKFHGWRSLVGCNPWGHEELGTTERLHFSLSCIGEGNGNPLQCSCLENPRDGGAWWAAIYGVAQSRTQLKWLSSSSSTHTRTWTSRAWNKDTVLQYYTLYGKVQKSTTTSRGFTHMTIYIRHMN